jgi:predicted HicB family RNase H-like nuclease
LPDNSGVTKGQEPRDYRLTTRIPTSLHKALVRAAKEDKRSVSDWIVVTLEAVIAERDKRK